MLETSYHYLITVGVHVGYSIKNSHRFCGWMVLAQRQKILLIDLSKFIYMLSRGILCVQTAVRFRHPVWFITLDLLKSATVYQAAQSCGEFAVGGSWIGGLITNFILVSETSWWRYSYLSPLVHSAKQRLRKDIYDNWLLTRNTWPRVIFLCGVRRSYRVAKEALRAQIPCIGIADTATGSHTLSIAVPGNDESLEALYFYNSLLCNTVLQKKFTIVFKWAAGIRKVSRFASFAQWFAHYGSRRFRDSQARVPYADAWSLPWHRYDLFFENYSAFATPASFFFNTLNAAMATSRKLAKSGSFFSLTSEKPIANLSLPQVRQFFLRNGGLFNGLLGMQSLASRRFLFKQWITPCYRAFAKRRVVKFTHIKSTFTSRHNFFDLLSPLPGDRDYVYKRAVNSPENPNKPLERICFKILSALFLLLSTYQRSFLQSPRGALNPLAYYWTTAYRRRLRRENAEAAPFFQEVIYFVLAKLLNLTSLASNTYRLTPVAKTRVSMKLLSSRRDPRKGFPRVFRKGRFFRWRASFFRKRFFHQYRYWIYRKSYLRNKQPKIVIPNRLAIASKGFTSFNLDHWRFSYAMLPRIYWQCKPRHDFSLHKLAIALETKQGHRSFVLQNLRGYPLLRSSMLWIRKNKV